MSLLMQYAGYSFPLGQVAYVPTVTTQFNSRGRPITRRVSIDLTGDLFADGPVANMALRQRLDAIAQIYNSDFAIFTDNGIPLLRYRAADALRGMSVASLVWPDPNGGQLVTHSTFRMIVEGIFRWGDIRLGDVVEWTESVIRTGTGRTQFGWMYPINAPPVSYQARLFTTVKIVQAGSAVGFGAYPRSIPDPIFTNPKYYMHTDTVIDRGHPYGDGLYLHPIKWQYFFELDYLPRNLFPAPWPG